MVSTASGIFTFCNEVQSKNILSPSVVSVSGRVMFEIGGVAEETAREALRLAIHKLPIKCKIVSKAEAAEMAGEHQ